MFCTFLWHFHYSRFERVGGAKKGGEGRVKGGGETINADYRVVFQDEPKLPPNETRALQKANRTENKEGFVPPMKRLFSNGSFMILCNSYGLNVGVLNAVATLLNQMFLMHFEVRRRGGKRFLKGLPRQIHKEYLHFLLRFVIKKL